MTEPTEPGTWSAVFGAVASLLVATGWAVLALRHPTVTYHFAPGVAAFAWAGVLAWRGGPIGRGAAVRATVGGTAVALAATWLLHARHALDGPTLVHRGSALAEFAIVIAVFSAAGWLLLHRRRGS